MSFYLPLYGLAQTTPRLREMSSRPIARRGGELGSLYVLSPRIKKQRFSAFDFFSAFAWKGGHKAEIDAETRMSGNFDLRRELLEGREKVPTEKDCHPIYCEEASTRTYYIHNRFPIQLVGNYENRLYAQPAKDWRIKTSKCTISYWEMPTQGGLPKVIWGDLSTTCEKVYNLFRVWLKESRRKALEAPPFTQGLASGFV